MPDTFTEISSQSWFSRIGGAFKGIVGGVILIAISFLLLFWNEGRAVKTYKTLKEGSRAVVSVAVDRVDSGNEGKLIHVDGPASTAEVLTDPVFGVSAKALKLKRAVEFYQWEETKQSETQKTLGGGTQTTTTYNYKKIWSPSPIDSSSFKDPTEHVNRTVASYETTVLAANQIMLGAFRLSQSLLNQINNFTSLPVPADTGVPAALQDKVKLSGAGFYIGQDLAAPQIGDLRISFLVIPPEEVSVVSEQTGNTFEPYTTKTGGTVELLQIGAHSAQEMFHSAQSQNTMITWFLRLLGFLLMFFGFAAIFKPLSVLADVVPFFGTIVEAGTSLIAFMLAAPLTLITIAIAWIVYRPLLGVALIAVAVGVVVLIKSKLKKPSASTSGAASSTT